MIEATKRLQMVVCMGNMRHRMQDRSDAMAVVAAEVVAVGKQHRFERLEWGCYRLAAIPRISRCAVIWRLCQVVRISSTSEKYL